MNSDQLSIYTQRNTELLLMLEQIEALNLSQEWTIIFSDLCSRRGFRVLRDSNLSQMLNISNVNSPVIKYLAAQDKAAGLNMLEDLSIKIIDEPTRLKAVQLIMQNGIKPSRNEIDLIIATAKGTPSLFDDSE